MLNPDSLKIKCLQPINHLKVWKKDSHERKVRLTQNFLADALHLNTARPEGELVEARRKLNTVFYSGGERGARLLSTEHGPLQGVALPAAQLGREEAPDPHPGGYLPEAPGFEGGRVFFMRAG